MNIIHQDKSQKKIRVLLTVPHLTSSASPYRAMMAIARYLPKDRFDLTICSLRRNGIEETGPLLDELGVSYFVARYRIKHPSELRRLIEANRVIKQHGPFDIQHSFDFTTIPVEAIVARLGGRFFIHQQRNMNEGGHLALLLMRIYLSHRVIAISNGVRNFLLENRIADKKIELIHNGMEVFGDPIEKVTSLKRNLHEYDERPLKILMVSQCIPRKKIEHAIAVIIRLKHKYPNILLEIIGPEYDQVYKVKLLQIITDYKAEENVIFLGNMDNQDVLDMMCQADIFLHCAEKEAFGWVIVEAFSQKLPVVAAKSEGAIDIIKHGKTGLLYDAGNIEQLRENIDYLIEHQAYRDEMAESAYQDMLVRFSAHAMVEKIADLYTEIMKKNE